MKKSIITLAIIAITAFNTLEAQSVNDIPLSEIDVEYIQIVGTSKLFSSKVNVQIDFGQSKKYFSIGKERVLKDSSGNKLEFNSMIDALNFMSDNGYEFVNAYTISVESQNVYHYVMRRRK